MGRELYMDGNLFPPDSEDLGGVQACITTPMLPPLVILIHRRPWGETFPQLSALPHSSITITMTIGVISSIRRRL